jgi:hypothetical protein
MMLAAQQALPEQVEKMMALQERWEANEARKAYNAAFAEPSRPRPCASSRTRKVDRWAAEGQSLRRAAFGGGCRHARPVPARPEASWKLTKDEKDWIEVTCTLSHSQGHSECVSMGGPPDAGGAKNAIQARASTISYLERYTLKAICGVAEGGEDDDGNGGKDAPECPARAPDKRRAPHRWAAGKPSRHGSRTRTEAERKLLDPHSDSLKEAAKEADARQMKILDTPPRLRRLAGRPRRHRNGLLLRRHHGNRQERRGSIRPQELSRPPGR